MAIITLTTDWGLKDHYVSAFKGRILSENPNIQLIDISHQVDRYDILQASFILDNVWKDFPKGTIHIVGINSIETDVNPHIIAVKDDHYFIGTDNGIFTLLFNEQPDAIFEIKTHQDSDFYTFASKDLFAKVACMLVSKTPIEELGTARDKLYKVAKLRPSLSENSIEGKVIYIDGYRNAITSIKWDHFNDLQKGRRFRIIAGQQFMVDKISDSYDDVPDFEMLATFGTNGFLEIALNKSEAAELLNLRINDSVRIEFIN